ncbi:Phospholipid scramblase 2 [Amphibalanus amphitrite]|uniref:Phospholipid scramblase n=1 Tax=Amphibalanus amphitrite TaxID=1232801 RepID=A0A6A4VS75_AMPAM|nr:Phospholipid scramblase 2 [Amphibalanus amphitrite]
MLPNQVVPAPTTQQPQPLGVGPYTTVTGHAVMLTPQPAMLIQNTVPGCPRDILSEVTDFDKGLEANKYSISTPSGQTVYWAAEESGCCDRNCCGRGRSFRMRVVDSQHGEVLLLDRPLRCSCCCCFCCLQELEVSSGGVLLGTVTQEFSVFYPSFSIRGPDGDVRLQITGPCWGCGCCSDIEFPVMSADGRRQVGNLTKRWNGIGRELANDSKTFSVSFPDFADPATRATLFGATILLSYVFFEKDNIQQPS